MLSALAIGAIANDRKCSRPQLSLKKQEKAKCDDEKCYTKWYNQPWEKKCKKKSCGACRECCSEESTCKPPNAHPKAECNFWCLTVKEKSWSLDGGKCSWIECQLCEQCCQEPKKRSEKRSQKRSEKKKDENNCRVRKSWAQMSRLDKELYMETVKKASTTERYEELIAMHGRISNPEYFKIHDTSLSFFHWHRWYILEFENMLRTHVPDITVPIWQWELDNLDESDTVMWGNLTEQNCDDNCVKGGIFESLPIPQKYDETTKIGHRYKSEVCFERLSQLEQCRQSRRTFPTLLEVESVLSIDDYAEFSRTLWQYNGVTHCAVGGLMCGQNSPYDPLFFMQHANFDKMWNQWQKSHPEDWKKPEAGLEDQFIFSLDSEEQKRYEKEFGKLKGEDFIDLKKQNYQGQNICVKYVGMEDSQRDAEVEDSQTETINIAENKEPQKTKLISEVHKVFLEASGQEKKEIIKNLEFVDDNRKELLQELEQWLKSGNLSETEIKKQMETFKKYLDSKKYVKSSNCELDVEKVIEKLLGVTTESLLQSLTKTNAASELKGTIDDVQQGIENAREKVCKLGQCCSWGGKCADMGDDGSGWCHLSPRHCGECGGKYIKGSPKICKEVKNSNTEMDLLF